MLYPIDSFAFEDPHSPQEGRAQRHGVLVQPLVAAASGLNADSGAGSGAGAQGRAGSHMGASEACVNGDGVRGPVNSPEQGATSRSIAMGRSCAGKPTGAGQRGLHDCDSIDEVVHYTRKSVCAVHGGGPISGCLDDFARCSRLQKFEPKVSSSSSLRHSKI
jgi:hypothetical protein